METDQKLHENHNIISNMRKTTNHGNGISSAVHTKYQWKWHRYHQWWLVKSLCFCPWIFKHFRFVWMAKALALANQHTTNKQTSNNRKICSIFVSFGPIHSFYSFHFPLIPFYLSKYVCIYILRTHQCPHERKEREKELKRYTLLWFAQQCGLLWHENMEHRFPFSVLIIANFIVKYIVSKFRSSA